MSGESAHWSLNSGVTTAMIDTIAHWDLGPAIAASGLMFVDVEAATDFGSACSPKIVDAWRENG
jgi:hypothetical protein